MLFEKLDKQNKCENLQVISSMYNNKDGKGRAGI